MESDKDGATTKSVIADQEERNMSSSPRCFPPRLPLATVKGGTSGGNRHRATQYSRSLAHDRDRNYADSYSSKLFGSPIPAPQSLYEAGCQSSCRAYEAARRNRPGIQAAAAALVVAVVTVWSTMYWDRRVTTCCDGRALRPPRSYILTILKKMASRGGPSRARTAHMTAAPHDFQCTSGRAGPFWNRGRGASGQGPTIIWSTLDHSCYHYYYYYHFLYLRRFG
jgi:hypothetical protein